MLHGNWHPHNGVIIKLNDVYLPSLICCSIAMKTGLLCLCTRGVYHQAITTITYHLKKYHDTIYITIFYNININCIIMKFVCLLHESELQVTELTEY